MSELIRVQLRSSRGVRGKVTGHLLGANGRPACGVKIHPYSVAVRVPLESPVDITCTTCWVKYDKDTRRTDLPW